ncbi:FAD-dependent oxidoreductase, partial [Micromonospora zhanjiangensis]
VPRPTRMLLRTPTAGPPWWSTPVGDFRAAGPAGLPSGYVGQWLFTVPSVEMAPYLDWLVERLRVAGGTLRRQRLSTLAEAAGEAPLLVNATGLGARTLADDPTVHPIRGQIVLVANPGLDTSIRDEDDPAGQTYVHPRSRDVVLGGTFEPYESGTVPDPDVARAILRRCAALVPELTDAPVLGHLAGLRPGRTAGPRVQADPRPLPGGTRVIHNYGHAGAGMTLSWGCADEVAALVDGNGSTGTPGRDDVE